MNTEPNQAMLPDGEEELLPAAGEGVTDHPAGAETPNSHVHPHATSTPLEVTPHETPHTPYHAANHVPVHAHQVGEQITAPEPIATPGTPLHAMPPHAEHPAKPGGWLRHTRLYLLEYLLSNLFLLSFIWLSNYPIYYLAGYIVNRHQSGSLSSSWMLFTVSYALIMFPLLAILLRRTLGEEELHPARYNQHPRKVLLNLAVFYAVLASVGYALAGVYLLLSPLIQENTGSFAVGYGIASFIMVGLHVVLVFLLPRHHDAKPSRFSLALIVSLIALVLSFIAFGTSVVPARNAKADSKTLDDLQSINEKIIAYTSQNKRLPDSLSDLTIDNEITSRGQSHGYRYEVEGNNPVVIQSNTQKSAESAKAADGTLRYGNFMLSYKLCATFKAESDGYDSKNVDNYESSYISTYSSHPAGDYCFKLKDYASGYTPSQTLESSPKQPVQD